MSEENPRKSKGENVMSGTITMHNDNISKLNVMSKLDEHAGTFHSSAFNDNNAMIMTNMCKDHLQKSHNVANINLHKVNSETTEIINSIKRIDPNDCTGVPNPVNVFPQLARNCVHICMKSFQWD